MSESNRERLYQDQTAAAKQQRLNRIIGVSAAVLAVVVLCAVVVMVAQRMAPKPPVGTPPNATSDGKAIVIAPGVAKQGAPVVELFFDYQCPVCHQFDTLYGGALRELATSGDIALHYRDLTFLDQNLQNDSSVRAGIGAACADTVGAYSAYHDGVFANQPQQEGEGFSDELLRETIPSKTGITGDRLTTFQACYDGESTKEFVKRANELGQIDLLEVDKQVSTPTVHVNGNALPLDALSGATTAAEVNEAIKKNA